MIGVFDSGFGGLSIFRELRKKFPEYSMMYLGDNARAPYGDHDRDTVTRYTRDCGFSLFVRGCRLVIIACNTASARTLPGLQSHWTLDEDEMAPILGVISPMAHVATETTQNGSIGLVATRRTVSSMIYPEVIAGIDPAFDLTGVPCPKLVPSIEAGNVSGPEVEQAISGYAEKLKESKPDTLILGCTHYEKLNPLWSKYLPDCTILNPSEIIPERLEIYLQEHKKVERGIALEGSTHFLTTGDPEHFKDVGSKFYGAIEQVEHIEL